MQLHRLLERQLHKLGMDAKSSPSVDDWRKFLSLVDDSYVAADQDRYTLERSLNISSEELQAQYQLQRSSYESRLTAIFSTMQDLIWLVDTHGVYLACNEMFERFYGEKAADIIGKTDCDFPGKELADLNRQYDRMTIEKNGPCVHEGWLTFASDGRRAFFEIVKTPMFNEAGETVGILGMARDFTHRHHADEQLRLSASVFSNIFEGIIISGPTNLIVDVNPAFTQLTGYTRDEVVGKNPSILSSGRHGDDYYDAMWESLKQHDYWQGEIWNRRKNDEIYPEMLSISVVRDSTGSVQHYIGAFTDISDIKQHQDDLDRIAHYDPLTGVPNRRMFADRLGQAISRANRTGAVFAVCYLDLDGFKPVNDRFGHQVGDACLLEITQRLQKDLREIDTIARLGGDEFVLLFNDLRHANDCEVVLARTLAIISQPLNINGQLVSITGSIGVALCPPDEPDVDTLLRHADQAMYRAKEAGKNQFLFFDPEQDRLAKAHHYKLLRLAQALEYRELIFHYQPKVNMATGAVMGLEALIRWQHPQEGLLPPSDFLSDLIGTELESKVGDYAIDSALKQIQAWNVMGVPTAVSVNISAAHLLKRDFVDNLKTALGRYPEVRPVQLELEILESAALSDIDTATRVLASCHGLGVTIALDDFGTGYSSLAYFRRLPVDSLKIDQSFVIDMLTDSNDLDIVEGIIKLSQTFGRPVVAEGVETLEHGMVLRALGCDLCQGYGIARPMPADQYMDWLDQWRINKPWAHAALIPNVRENLPVTIAGPSHRVWVDRLADYLRQPSAQSLVKLNLQQCHFGHWYENWGANKYGSLSEFKAIEPLHDRIHELSREMVAQAEQGHAHQAEQKLLEIQVVRDRLIEKIDALTSKLSASS